MANNTIVMCHKAIEFLVDIYDETGETVGLATILTMVRKIDQSS